MSDEGNKNYSGWKVRGAMTSTMTSCRLGPVADYSFHRREFDGVPVRFVFPRPAVRPWERFLGRVIALVAVAGVLRRSA